MARVTNGQLHYALKRLIEVAKYPKIESFDGQRINPLRLDHLSNYGWQLQMVINKGGGITVVNRGVNERLTAYEMLCFIHGMIRAFEDGEIFK